MNSFQFVFSLLWLIIKSREIFYSVAVTSTALTSAAWAISERVATNAFFIFVGLIASFYLSCAILASVAGITMSVGSLLGRKPTEES